MPPFACVCFGNQGTGPMTQRRPNGRMILWGAFLRCSSCPDDGACAGPRPSGTRCTSTPASRAWCPVARPQSVGQRGGLKFQGIQGESGVHCRHSQSDTWSGKTLTILIEPNHFHQTILVIPLLLWRIVRCEKRGKNALWRKMSKWDFSSELCEKNILFQKLRTII